MFTSLTAVMLPPSFSWARLSPSNTVTAATGDTAAVAPTPTAAAMFRRVVSFLAVMLTLSFSPRLRAMTAPFTSAMARLLSTCTAAPTCTDTLEMEALTATVVTPS